MSQKAYVQYHAKQTYFRKYKQKLKQVEVNIKVNVLLSQISYDIEIFNMNTSHFYGMYVGKHYFHF